MRLPDRTSGDPEWAQGCLDRCCLREQYRQSRSLLARQEGASGIAAALPAQDPSRAKTFYVEKVALQAIESDFLEAKQWAGGPDCRRGCQPALRLSRPARLPGEFTRAVIQVTDGRAAVEGMWARGVEFEEYDTPETRTENGIVGHWMEARGRGSRTRQATWSASFAPWQARDRGELRLRALSGSACHSRP